MTVNRIDQLHSITHRPAKAKRAAPAVAAIPQGFVVCPPQLATAAGWQQQIYRLAYERAKAAAEVPRHHRMLFCVWN